MGLQQHYLYNNNSSVSVQCSNTKHSDLYVNTELSVCTMNIHFFLNKYFISMHLEKNAVSLYRS